MRRRSRHGRTLGRVHLQALDQLPRAHVLFAAKHCNVCSPSSHVRDNDTMPTVAVANVLGLVVGCCVLALIASAVEGECSAEPRMQRVRGLSVFKAANAPAGRSKLQRLSPHIEHTFA